MLLLQLSATSGPAECALAVTKALQRLLREAVASGVEVDEIERVGGEMPGTLRSVVLTLEGEGAQPLAERWNGTVQWICASPYRPRHGRKNWFIGVSYCVEPEPAALSAIRFETCKASGPGGQHVNKTESAVRATHVASGISVKVQSERSQHANKRLAALLLGRKLAEAARRDEDERRAERHRFHRQVERGNAGLVFKGERFEPMT